MNEMTWKGRSIYCVLVLLQFLVARESTPQAWVPPKHTGTITFVYQNQFKKDFRLNGEPISPGTVRLQGVFVNLDYSLTDKLAISATLPFLASKYDGTELLHDEVPFDGIYTGYLDNGKYHSSFQDFGFNLRYNFSTRPIVFTPYIRYGVPTNNYPFLGFSAVGQRLQQLEVGAHVGRILDPFLPDAYFQLSYGFAFVKKIEDINLNRSNINLQFGYFLSPSFQLYGLVHGMHMHGGVSPYQIYTPDFTTVLNQGYWDHHDQLETERTWNVGGGVSFALNDSMDASVALLRTVYLWNGHALNYQFSAGIAWSFGSIQ
jgi:hypothetical protein